MKLANAREVERYCAFLRTQETPLEVSHGPWKEKRSNKQNAYLWRAVYQPLVEVAGFSKDDWHEYFCGEKWGWVDHVKPSGEVERKPARTTTKPDTLPADEFQAFVNWIEPQAAERGAFVLEEWTP